MKADRSSILFQVAVLWIFILFGPPLPTWVVVITLIGLLLSILALAMPAEESEH